MALRKASGTQPDAGPAGFFRALTPREPETTGFVFSGQVSCIR